jgi:hypothetical protein
MSQVPVAARAATSARVASMAGRRSRAARSSPMSVCVVIHRQNDGRVPREALGDQDYSAFQRFARGCDSFGSQALPLPPLRPRQPPRKA